MRLRSASDLFWRAMTWRVLLAMVAIEVLGGLAIGVWMAASGQ